MHEWAVADNLVKLVTDACRREDLASVSKVVIRVGVLQQIVPGTLETAFSYLTEKTEAAGARLEIESVPVQARCRGCGFLTTENELLISCKNCGSTDLKITAGRELYIDYLEGERRDGAGNDEIRKPNDE